MEYGLIGGQLGHSYSRQIHEMVGGYSYELNPLPTEAEARAFLQQRNFKAINVTIPYKRLVMEYCDELDPAARAIGAVNTVVNRDGRLYGYNTDYAGFGWLARRHDVRFTGKTVMILGTGGTSNTVAAVCRGAGARAVYKVSRSGRDGALTYERAACHPEVEILINTSPAGMYPDVGSCLVDLEDFPNLEAVLDVVYNPFRTELVLRAAERGVTAAGGFEMLVAQAVYAAQYFTGRTFDAGQAVPEVSRRLQRELANVSLIGMPGCGKSSIGAALSKRLGKAFVDLDEEIERRTGCNIPDIFAREGEEAFRRYEAETLAEVGKRTGQVIACGGGVIKTAANVHALRQNGTVLWVQRALDKLATGGRPLSRGGAALKQLQTERTPLYRAAADAVLDNSASLDRVVQEAVQLVDAQPLL